MQRNLVYATQGYKAGAGFPSGPFTIWRANVDGRHPVAIGSGRDPQLSPDGREVAYANGELYLIPVRGGKPRRLTSSYRGSGDVYGTGFSWVPDSRHVVVYYDRGSYPDNEEFADLVDVANGSRRRLPGSTPKLLASSRFSLSPDGRSAVFAATSSYGQYLYVTDLRSGRTRRLTKHDSYAASPVWGPKWIAFSEGHEIWLISADGKHLHRLGSGYSFGRPLAWSAGGRRLLVETVNTPPSPNLSGVYPIVPFQVVDVPSGRAEGNVNASLLAPSRDGSVALVNTCTSTPTRASGSIAIAELPSGKPHAISSGYACAASWNR
jgi:Tol biopolymer transport system component